MPILSYQSPDNKHTTIFNAVQRTGVSNSEMGELL